MKGMLSTLAIGLVATAYMLAMMGVATGAEWVEKRRLPLISPLAQFLKVLGNAAFFGPLYLLIFGLFGGSALVGPPTMIAILSQWLPWVLSIAVAFGILAVKEWLRK